MNKAILASCLFLSCSVALADIPVVYSGHAPDRVTLIYNAPLGNLALDTGGMTLTHIEIDSFVELFRDDVQLPHQLSGIFDVLEPHGLNFLDPFGFGDQDFGHILLRYWSCDALANDLSVDGTAGDGSRIRGRAGLYCVPEELPPEWQTSLKWYRSSPVLIPPNTVSDKMMPSSEVSQVVPEPSMWVLLIGLLPLWLRFRK